jgi:hypothetical protein
MIRDILRKANNPTEKEIKEFNEILKKYKRKKLKSVSK